MIDLYSHFILQNIWGGLQKYFYYNKNIYKLKLGARRRKLLWSPQSPISLAPWVNALALVCNTISNSFKSQLYVTSQACLCCFPLALASNRYLELPWTPDLLPKPAPPTVFPGKLQPSSCTGQRPSSHSSTNSRYTQNRTVSHRLHGLRWNEPHRLLPGCLQEFPNRSPCF